MSLYDPDRARAYYQKNKIKIRARVKEWYSDPTNAAKAKATARAFYLANKERCKANGRQNRIGVTPEDYEEALKNQKNVCAICGKPEKGKALSADHNHATGKFRALLCSHCNRGLGCFEDSVRLLKKAALYLEFFGGST